MPFFYHKSQKEGELGVFTNEWGFLPDPQIIFVYCISCDQKLLYILLFKIKYKQHLKKTNLIIYNDRIWLKNLRNSWYPAGIVSLCQAPNTALSVSVKMHVSTRHSELAPQITWHALIGHNYLAKIPSEPSVWSQWNWHITSVWPVRERRTECYRGREREREGGRVSFLQVFLFIYFPLQFFTFSFLLFSIIIIKIIINLV